MANVDIMGLNRIDNSEDGKKLHNILSSLLGKYGVADFASGYFNIGGFNLIAKQLVDVKRFRLLIGREPGYRGHLKTQTGNPVEIINRQFKSDLNSEELRKETITIVDSLIEFLKREDVEVRLFTKGFFHSKAYLFPSVSIIGSSNFTSAGLTANSELNAVQHGEDTANGYQKWFEKFWQQSEDFKDQLIDILIKSKFGDYEYTPHEIFMKTLYTYFKDEMDFETKFAGKSVIELMEFQEEAFDKAKRIIDKYGGVMIADSVGLGKTYIGKKLLEYYAYFLRKKALVICPAQLRDSIWEKHLITDNIPAQIISQEELGQSNFPTQNYKDIEIILIDESHNFRNFNNRFDNLNRIIGGNQNVIIILMTATPINNSLFDLYNQLSFLTKGDDGYFFRAGIHDMFAYFKEAENGKDNLFNLLEEIVIRRTRHYIKEHYMNATINGKPIHFPVRKLQTIHYNLESTYNQIYDYIVECMKDISFTVYNVEQYKISKPDKLKAARGNALIGLMKTLVLKRFESSVEAFRITVQRQLHFYQEFLKFLDNGLILDSSSHRKILKYIEFDDDDRIDEVKDELPQVTSKYYDTGAIRQNVIDDIGILKKIEMSVFSIGPEKDTKLIEFKSQLKQLKGRKVLIFSYFKDTAKYIYKEITNDKQFMEWMGDANIKLIDSDAHPKYRLKYIESFAPKVNKREDIIGTPEEIDILISTDVLSEGQNLQDSDLLINYDLHWNPTRMVQRAGRIDRLGSDFNVLTIYNIFPEEGLENLLGLVRRLQERIAKIDANIGLDASILGEIVDPKTFNALERIKIEDDSIIDEMEQIAELASRELMKQELAKFMLNRGKGVLESLPDGIHSGLEKNKGRGLFSYFIAGTDHYWRYYNLNTNTILDNKYDIFRFIYCDEKDPRTEFDYPALELLDEVKKHIKEEIVRKELLPHLPKTLEKVQRDLSSILEVNVHIIPERAEEIMEIVGIIRNPLNRTLLRELKNILQKYREGGTYKNIVNDMSVFKQSYFSSRLDVETSEQYDNEMENELKLVCYELIG